MATAGEPTITFTIRFEGQRLTLRLSKDSKVGEIVRQATESLKLPPEGLTVLHQGLEVPDDALVKDAMLHKQVTVIHLVRKTEQRRFTTRMVSDPTGKLFGYCGECKGFVQVRATMTCSKCSKEEFVRSSATPLDYLADYIAPELLVGMCNACKGEDIQPRVIFECRSCETRNVPLLRMVRENIHNIPCMKCEKRQPNVLRFSCAAQHCMCLPCFGNMCKQQLGMEQFRHDQQLGFSIGCPGGGDDCKSSLIQDPHHFCVVDNGGPFYNKYKEMSAVHYSPPGEEVLCPTCKIVIDVSQSVAVPAEQPAVSVSGQSWWSRLFHRAPKKPSPKVRRRTSCRQCNRNYCVGCKQLWHQGDCVPVTEEIAKEEKVFPIDSDKSESARWPKDKD